MYKSYSKAILLIFVVIMSGCATSMAPNQFSERFPQATHAKYYEKRSSNEAISAGECQLLVENRKYTAPIGLTLDGDVKNGATGVDEWVKLDKGNAYAINNFEWISVGNDNATQLIVYFNTLLCQ